MRKNNCHIKNFFNQLRFLLLGCFAMIICSCSQNKPTGYASLTSKDTLKAPVVVPAKGMVVYLDTCPQPAVISIPTKEGGFNIVQNDAGVIERDSLKPPLTREAD